MTIRIGADVGGTFTDVVIQRDGTFLSGKVLTTHAAPEEGILAGIATLATEHGVDLAAVEQVIHGTTLATNALIERRGAHTAFVTTEGFRDVIETRTEGRYEQYDLNIVLPKPLIERKDRFVVAERRDARGDVLLPFDEIQANAVIDQLIDGGYESVAVGFLHSYRNATHEQRFRDLLLGRAPGLAVSISSDVSPQMREYERFNTVCANAYVQPMMASYLHRLEDRLRQLGAACELYLMHSGGGLLDVDTAAAFPVRLVESGPAGGAIFAAHLAARYGRDRIVSFDMGGTTAKVALVEDRVPQTAKTFEVARTTRFKKGSGMPISIPVIEMIEIGAGGGSIAGVDTLGQIRIGPRSAGSEPGPAAYDRGGTDATVTDANVCLGRLHPDTFGATAITLSPARAADAVLRAVGEPLDLHVETAAVGIAEVVDENMTNAARVHAVEHGKDLAGFSMIAFGGGAPLHATRLMDKLGLTELFVPQGAGVGSAIGFLLAPFSYEAVRSFFTTSDEFDADGAQATLQQLQSEAETFVKRGTDGATTTDRQVSMRYRGQGWEIPVTVPAGDFDAATAVRLVDEFTARYRQFFGRAIDGLTVEAVSWSVRVASIVDSPEPLDLVNPAAPSGDLDHAETGADTDAEGSRPIFDSALGAMVASAIVQRDDLSVGATVAGPAVIVEPQTTTVLGSHHVAVVQRDGTLRISRESSLVPRPDRSREGGR